MNKIWLKQEVSSKYITENVVVKGSYIFVEIYCQVDGKEYRASDFAKWSTVDMTTVAKATRMYQFLLKKDCGCEWCREATKAMASLIERFNWSEDRGIAIATGRAIADIVQQVLGDKAADQIVKSKSGQVLETSLPDYSTNLPMTNDRADYLGIKTDYARSKVNPGKMINND